MKCFRVTHKVFENNIEYFSETDAPDWLTSKKTTAGSTIDDRWFWKDHVLTLQIGESVSTDFRIISRIK